MKRHHKKMILETRMKAWILRSFKHPSKTKLMMTLLQTRINFKKIRYTT